MEIRKTHAHTIPCHAIHCKMEWWSASIGHYSICWRPGTTRNHPNDLELYIRKVCMAYSSSVHPSTGFSPFFLIFGCEASIDRFDVWPMGQTPLKIARTVPEYTINYTRNNYKVKHPGCMCPSESTADQSIKDRKPSMTKGCMHGNPFDLGRMVWLHSPAIPRGQSKKLHHP